MAPEQRSSPAGPNSGSDTRQAQLFQLFHKLNNQLGIILANAELLETRLTDTTHRARAGQVASSALDAIATSQQLRRLFDTPSDGQVTSGE